MLELSDWFLFWLFDSFVHNGLLLHPGGMWCSIRTQSCGALRGKLLRCSVIGGLWHVSSVCIVLGTQRCKCTCPWEMCPSCACWAGESDSSVTYKEQWVKEVLVPFVLRWNNLNGNWLPCIPIWKQRRCVLGPHRTHWRVRHFVGKMI